MKYTKKPRYLIQQSDDPLQLETDVEAALCDGWQLHGPLIVAPQIEKVGVLANSELQYIQALIKQEKNEVDN